MDRNENQNSYRNTRRKRGNTKAHEGLKRRVNVLMVLVILLIAAIAAILFFGKKSLTKETIIEKKTGACPDLLFCLLTNRYAIWGRYVSIFLFHY